MKRIISIFLAMSFLISVNSFSANAYSDTVVSDINWSHFTLGNVNADSEINILDLVRMKKHLAGLPVTISITASDLNSDGKINAADLTLIKNLLLNNQ